MMERLRDRMADPDAVLARAARLVASAPTLDDSEMAKRRVMARMELRRTGPSRWPALLRPAPALTLALVAGAALAGATVGREPLVNAYRSLTGTAATPSAAPAHAVRSVSNRTPVIPAAPAIATVPGTPVVAPVAPVPGRNPAASPARSTPPAATRRGVRAPVVPTSTSSEAPGTQTEAPAPAVAAPPAPEPRPAAPRPPSAAESTLVAGAARALRVERDPVRAGTLLDEYLRRFPDGVLTEEALALAVQAATARGDTRARDLARTYLQRYPQGRFARQARATASTP